MQTYMAHAEGSVSSTVVVDARGLAWERDEVIPVLRQLVEHADLLGDAEKPITKLVLIQPSSHPMYDLDYWFFQLIPGPAVTFDDQGSCGHSILASIQVAMKWGWLPGATPGMRIRVYIRNIGDSLVCEVDRAMREGMNCTVHFVENPQTTLQLLLPTGHALDLLETKHGVFEASLVTAGNPYVFVDARQFGLRSGKELFEAGEELLLRLEDVRREAARLLDWDPAGVFPKIAAVADFEQGMLLLRAISIPKWHPTIALTGAACVGAAAAIDGTLVRRIARSCGAVEALPMPMLGAAGTVRIRTKGGTTAVTTATTGTSLEDALLYNSIADKSVRLIGPVPWKKGVQPVWELRQNVFI